MSTGPVRRTHARILGRSSSVAATSIGKSISRLGDGAGAAKTVVPAKGLGVLAIGQVAFDERWPSMAGTEDVRVVLPVAGRWTCDWQVYGATPNRIDVGGPAGIGDEALARLWPDGDGIVCGSGSFTIDTGSPGHEVPLDVTGWGSPGTSADVHIRLTASLIEWR